MRFAVLAFGLLQLATALPAGPGPQAEDLETRADTQAKAVCSPAVVNGVQSIQADIRVQKQESAAVDKLLKLEQANPPNPAAIQAQIGTLLTNVNNGLSQVMISQKTLPADNPAQGGISTLIKGKGDEKNLVQLLKGDLATDSANIKTLQGDFQGGIALNQKNAKDAASGCTLPK